MEKVKWKDVAHLYVNCRVKINNPTDKEAVLGAVNMHPPGRVTVRWPDQDEWSYADLDELMPILWPLSEAKREEAEPVKAMYKQDKWGMQTLESQAAVTAYLLSRSFDLFNLIETGQAMYAA